MPIRILVADDHGVVRRGLRLQLEQQGDFVVVGEAADGREAVKLAETCSPDVILMDIAMPNLNGIDAASQILKKNPRCGVVILSMHSDESYLVRALSAGAKGYLMKDTADLYLTHAVQAAAAGKPFFSPEITQTLLEDYLSALKQRGLEDSYELLTGREKEILQLLAEGKSNKETAAMLGLSPYTVETHRTHIMQKLNLHSAVDIVLYAVRKKIIS